MATYTTRQLEDRMLELYDAGDMDSVEVLREELKRRKSGSIVDPIMQGLTLGWADELGEMGARLGASLAGASPRRARQAGVREKARQRGELQAYRERDPVGAFIGEMASAFIPGAGAAHTLMPIASRLGLAGIPAMMATGATEGLVAGAGAADENMGVGAGVGAATGALMAPAMAAVPRAITGIAGGARGLGQRAAQAPVSTTPGRVMADIMEQEQLTPTILRARQRQMGPEATMADLTGPMGIQTAQGVLQKDRSGRAIAQARRTMGGRAARSTQRLQQDLQDITGVDRGMLESLDEINTRQRAASSQAYDEAMAVPIDPGDPELVELLNRPSVRKSLRQAVNNARDEGIITPELDAILAREEDWTPESLGDLFPNMRALDQMKKAMDWMVNSAYQRGDPGADSMRKARNAFRERLDGLNPAYRKAREIWAGDEALKDAMEQGEQMFSTSTRKVEEYVRDLSQSEREAYLRGVKEAIDERMGNAMAGQIREFNFLEKGNTRKKLQSVFVRPGMNRAQRRQGQRASNRLYRTLVRERNFAENRNVLTRGSETAQRQAAGEALDTRINVPQATEMALSPKTFLPRAMLGGAMNFVTGLNQPTIQRLAELMFTPGGAEQAIEELTRRGFTQEQIRQLTASWSRAGVTAAPSTAMGIMNVGEGDYAP